MGEFDRSEWTPSEGDLRAELCNAREIDWPAEASKEANRRQQWMITAPDEYGEYMQGLLKDGRNFPQIPLCYMDAPADWMGKSLEAILNQVQSSPEEYQGYITGMVNRYLTACFKRLGGKWPSDIWDGSGNPYFTRICYDFCCPEWVGDDDLLRKIIVLQKLQAMISERVGQDDPAEQAGEPAAGELQARKFIGWMGTAEQLDRLTAELQKERFIASAEAFEGQFDKARRVVEEPCEWRDEITLLAYLFEILKENGLVKKKSASDRLIGSRFFNGDYSADGNPETFSNLRQARSNYKDNNTTLSGGLNTGKKGVPDKGPMIHEIVSRITDRG
ncbi:MAG: hypothetical protein JW989_08140 [Chlorobiaceae bacterium]|nr:hypothetical protein [Chlorobiaceae bacterium]